MGNSEPTPQSVNLHYIKSAGFREVACDGALGGLTPQRKLWLSFYTERFPLPQVVNHKVIETDGGSITLDPKGTPIAGRDGVIRNVEFGVYLDLRCAEELHKWLGDHIEALKGVTEK